ncbi:flagellar hook-associated protein FlgK [Motiliproteus sp. MSK22-1]|uniref:flagellar hook-associated protein FlgK n=1 Tax=Motiliproteus sp. MSK22-1 TaxID=1897630 RepID=UPI000977DED5|nr:flagellar hook-associated protein FlgK [Motiliproteus sp. MSK22-1]OMH30009.1 flagellar hook-associated protein FlgK [Motiliproteus sp. MSK22-1]
MSLINIGVQALNANQLALDVTGQNIANVNSPGYSRQIVEFDSRTAPALGVEIQSISRMADSFATQQLWTDTAASAGSEAFVFFANQLDDELANSDTGISSAMDLFFGALQTGVDDPASIPAREVVLAESDALVRRFNRLDNFIRGHNDDITTNVKSLVNQTAQIASQIADLNEKVSFAVVRGEPANELKDQREELVRQLSEIMGVSVQTNGEDGDIDVFVGNGQPLVIGSNASSMTVLNGDPDPDDLRVMVQVGAQLLEVGDQIKDGEVGGLLTYREETLVPAWNELGRLAIVFSDSMNEQHLQGMDLDSQQGINFFNDLSLSGVIRGSTQNSSTMASTPLVRVVDATQLKASDYEITFTQSDEFTIVRKSDGQQFKLSDFTLDNSDPSSQADMTYFADPAGGSLRLTLDGVTINLETTDGFIKGDKFLVIPVRNGADDIELNLTSGRQLAFASPVRGTGAVDNSGVANISSIDITEPDNLSFSSVPGQLTPPLEIVFNAGTPTTFDVLDVTDPNNPQPYMLTSTTPSTPLTGLEYTSGQAIQLNGFSVTIEKQPDAGDRFSFVYNTDGISDNSNAFKQSALQDAQLVDGASYQDNYGVLVERVGTETSVAQLNAQANATVLKNAQSVRDSIAGVNMDEEAANIVKFQQAYQAAAQLISTSRTLFDTILSATGG